MVSQVLRRVSCSKRHRFLMSGRTNLPKEFKVSKLCILLVGWNLHQYGLQSQKRMFRSVSKLSAPLESWILVLQNLNLFFHKWGRRPGQTNWEEPCNPAEPRPGFPNSFREAGDGWFGFAWTHHLLPHSLWCKSNRALYKHLAEEIWGGGGGGRGEGTRWGKWMGRQRDSDFLSPPACCHV